jgi:uncharacterized protein YqeY
MSIFDRVTAEMTEAMKARAAARLTALRSIRAAFLTELKKDNAATLPDEVCTTLLRRLEKQRGESIEAFESAGRPDRVAEERAELAVIQEFLPKLADEATTLEWVKAAIVASNASAPGDVGKVMGAVMKAHKGDLDGNLARRLASELLGASSRP